MTYAPAFGTYSIPRGINIAQVGMARQVPNSKAARYDGARTLNATLQLKRFSLKGTLIRPLGNVTANYLRTQIDALKTGLAQGPANFVIDSDRYWRQCQAETYADSYDPTSYQNYVDIAFDIVTGDPFSYETAAQSAARNLTTTGQTQAATNGGNAYAAPSLALTVGSSGTLAATITNQATGDVFTLSGAVTSGDIITVDGLLQTVTRGGSDVITLFDGQFPRLAVGANTFLFAWTSSSFSHVTISFNNRWY